MRFLLSPMGSRGDFQPLLALAVGLRRTGHRVVMATTPDFASECESFGIEFRPVGTNIQTWMNDRRMRMTPLAALQALFVAGRQMGAPVVRALIPLAREADMIVGGGAQIAYRTVAEHTGTPCGYVAYTPQFFPSAHHAPLVLPIPDAPRIVNLASWFVFRMLAQVALGSMLSPVRKELGLDPIRDVAAHFLSGKTMILAADPEIAPVPPDVTLPNPPSGHLHLPDERPLGEDVDRFLDAGSPPVYVGFGSMTDSNPEQTTRAIAQAIRAVGCRAVVSAGWGKLGGEGLGKDAIRIGPVSHRKLFPRVAAVVHHGGAGTTMSAARAGVPQVVVPHVFDQFAWARCVRKAGLGPTPLPKRKFAAGSLTGALREVLGDSTYRRRAAEVGERVRARDGVANAVAILESGCR